jgi:thiamine biosynthesis protein ThiS
MGRVEGGLRMDERPVDVALMVNGEPRRVASGETLAALLARLGVEAETVAVERNRAIVPRSAFAATRLAEGDRIEIVQFVGGG